MINLAIFSIFRDSAGAQIERYRRQMDALDITGFNVRWYLGEGDSVDATYNQLSEYAQYDDRVQVHSVTTGIRRYGSVVDPERFRCLALSTNPLLNAIAAEGWADYAMLVESDLLFEPDLLQRLYANLPDKKSVIAPMIWIDRFTRFYDVWGFRKLNGQPFLPFGKAWYECKFPVSPFQVSTVGSVVLMPAEVIYSGMRYTEDEVIVGLVKQAGEAGYKIYADNSTHVRHPNG
jgi:hypothetical protein